MSEHATHGDTIMGMDGDDWLQGGAGADTIDGGGGMDWMVYAGSDEGVSVDIGPGGVNRGGHAEGDVLKSIENIYGSMHNDVITGDIGANHIMGNGGADVLNGGGGADTLEGNGGSDELNGGSGADALHGGQGDDVLSGDTGNDMLAGGAGADTIDGGVGIDLVRYASSPAGVTVDLGTGAASGGHAEGDVISGVEGVIGSHHADMLTLGDGGGKALGYMGNDMLMGGAGSDSLGGGMGDDTVSGGMGDDTLYGGKGADRIDVGSGNNTAMGGAGNDTFILWKGLPGDVNNMLSDFSGSEMIEIGDADTGKIEKLTHVEAQALLGSETSTDDGNYSYALGGLTIVTPIRIDGSNLYAEPAPVRPDGPLTDGDDVWPGEGVDNSGNDHVQALGGDDMVDGGAGNDTLEGGVGDDTLMGGAGNDTLVGGAGADVLHGDDGEDTVTYEASPGGVAVDLGGQAAAKGGDAEGDVLAGIETVIGSRFTDELSGTNAAESLMGGGGADILKGMGGNDMLYGGADADVLEGGSGNDNLMGGSGDDDLTGGSGADVFVFRSNDGNNTINDFSRSAGDKIVIGNGSLTASEVKGVIDAGTDDGGMYSYSYGGTTIMTSTMLEVADFRHRPDPKPVGISLTTGNDLWPDSHDDDNTGDNRVLGLGGNDTIFGGLGNDTWRVATALTSSWVTKAMTS